MGVMVVMAVVFTWLLLKMLIRWWIFVFIRYIERSAVKMEWDGNAPVEKATIFMLLFHPELWSLIRIPMKS
jgi:hypothetical protein